jgi:hypothetical protein
MTVHILAFYNVCYFFISNELKEGGVYDATEKYFGAGGFLEGIRAGG